MYKDIAYLIFDSITYDKDGYPIKSINKYEIYCNKKSVKRTEYYKAMQISFKPSITLELRLDDYEYAVDTHDNNTPINIEYNGKIYDIIRDYSDNESYVELTCGYSNGKA